MRLIFRYMKRYSVQVIVVMILKLTATMTELMLPYILEHLLDNVVPTKDMARIIIWGCLMILCAVLTCLFNIFANRKAVNNAHHVSYDVRRDLFDKTVNLSGTQFDSFGLPSLTSRMTSDSYNVQNFARAFQTICVRAPIMLVGGIIVTITMDAGLSLVLCAIVPLLLAVTVTISAKGIPLYKKVQEKLDDVVRVMRENITGIRVVKALSKTEYEKKRFHKTNDEMTDTDIRTSTYMAIPGPFMQLCLNIGLTLVVFIGAKRVNNGDTEPGVILAFLTYFNMILQSVMAINRIFVMVSKASASADRIDKVIQTEPDQRVMDESELPPPSNDAFISFEHVDFSYKSDPDPLNREADKDKQLSEEEREQCLYDISFTLNKGESLGIIGPTGCGKTTIINMLMRFYDADSGNIYVDGKEVRSYEKDELHRKFGVVFQNDIVFNDTLKDNITFGRNMGDGQVRLAVEDAMAAEFIDETDGGLEYVADIKGANLSGGQKQRILISRALAGNPEILVLDDSSSALDYKTDSMLRRAIHEHHGDSTTIMIAQRISSIMGMTHIMVMDNGRCIGYGDHRTLLETCPAYKETYDAQMNAELLK